MQLTTLVDLLERDLPGLGDSASARSKLGRLYAERGCHDVAVAEFRSARSTMARRGETRGSAAADVTADLATSLADAGRLAEAKREARRALAAGPVSPSVSARLERIIAKR
ncbi:MAG: tetratricopeptide repeat protein [Nannocystaceae bacterium]